MKSESSLRRYSFWAIALHWLLAFALAFQIGLGWRLGELRVNQGLFDITQLHKSIGISILILSILRLALRYFKPPVTPHTDEKWAMILSKITHISLYIFMIGAPLTGWLLVSTSKLGIDTYLFDILYWPHLPVHSFFSAYMVGFLHQLSEYAHEFLAWLAIILFFLHVLGALRHQYFKNEPILEYILPIHAFSGRIIGSLTIISLLFLIFVTYNLAQFLGNDYKKMSVKNSNIQANIVETQDDRPVNNNKNPKVDKVSLAQEGKAENVILEKNITAEKPVSDLKKGVNDNKPKPIKPSRWSIVSKQPISFSVKWNGELLVGSFSDWDADIYFSADALDQSRIEVDINLASVVIADSTANDAIKGVDFLNIAASSDAKFISESIMALRDGRYEMRGFLTLKNIRKASTIFFKLQNDNENTRAQGNSSINRLHYKVGETNYPGINDIVSVSFDFVAKE